MVHLVRHGRSAQDPALPSWEWSLAAGAEVGVGALRASGELPADALWVSSTELKAVSTAKLLTSSDIGLDAELREAVRDPAWLSLRRLPGDGAAVLRPAGYLRARRLGAARGDSEASHGVGSVRGGAGGGP